MTYIINILTKHDHDFYLYESQRATLPKTQNHVNFVTSNSKSR